jgi:hypothetical protein
MEEFSRIKYRIQDNGTNQQILDHIKQEGKQWL